MVRDAIRTEPATDVAVGPEEHDVDIYFAVVTRLNVPHKTGLHLDADWLKHRLGLFERFCVPSVMNQTVKGSNKWWHVFASADTPEEFADQLRAVQKRVPNTWLHWIVGDRPFRRETLADVLETVIWETGLAVSRVITMRLDSDDAMNLRFVERLRTDATAHEDCFLNYAGGVELDLADGRCRAVSRKWNEHVGYVERPSKTVGLVTCFAEPQVDKLCKWGKAIDMQSRMMWLKVFHDRNCVQKERRGTVEMDVNLSREFRTGE